MLHTLRLDADHVPPWTSPEDRSIDDDAVAPDLPPEVSAAWQRAREGAAEVERSGDPGLTVSRTELADRRAQRDASIACRELEALLVSDERLVATDARLAVADVDGIVLETFGGGSFGPFADAIGLRPGRSWAESMRGPNGVGTALATDAPTLVVGRAHAERQLHAIQSIGVPVPRTDGGPALILVAGMHRDGDGTPIARALRIVARAVSRALQRRASDAAHGILPPALERALARTEAVALLIDRPGIVRSASPAGHAFLEHGSEHDDGPATLDAVLGLGWAALEERARARTASGQALRVPGARESQPYRLYADALVDADDHCPSILVVLDDSSAARPRAGGGHLRDVSVRTIVGSDERFVSAKHNAERFAKTDLPILLLAETGAGKEVLARAIHDSSPRAAGPFIALNCGSLSPQLLESELFGYGPGAFTGARPEGHDGKIHAAAGGTLFLDEVAEMPPALQSSMLRVLEDGSYYRVGETVLQRADIRIICATWRDLPALVRAGHFRQDLYYRIKGTCIAIPPLRHRSDLSDIANFLLDQLCFELKLPQARLTSDAMAICRRFPWPGNIRELRSALHHALVLADGRRMLHPAHLPEEIRDAPAHPASDGATDAPPSTADAWSPEAVAVAAAPGPAGPGPTAPGQADDPWRALDWATPSQDGPLSMQSADGPPVAAGGIRPPRRPASVSAGPIIGDGAGATTAGEPPTVGLDHDGSRSAVGSPTGPPVRLDDLEAAAVRHALDATGGNLSATARQLGVARSTLYRIMDKHGLRERAAT